MAVLTKDKLIRLKLKKQTLYFTDLDGEIIIQELSVEDREKLEKIVTRKDNLETLMRDYRQALILMSIVDEEGNKMLTQDDLPSIEAWPGSLVHQIVAAASRLSKLRESDFEEVRKN